MANFWENDPVVATPKTPAANNSPEQFWLNDPVAGDDQPSRSLVEPALGGGKPSSRVSLDDWRSRQPSTNVEMDGKPVYKSGGVENFAAGINDFLNKEVYGGLVDRARNVVNWGIIGANAVTDAVFPPEPGLNDLVTGNPPKRDLLRNTISDDNVGGSKWWAQQFQHIGVNDPDHVIAINLGERIARMGGEGVAAAVAPEAILALLGRAGIVGRQANELLGALVGNAKSVGGSVRNAVAGGVAGAGAQTAMEMAPEPWKPIAATVGAVAGGLAGAGAASLPSMARAGGRMAADYLAPITQGGRERLVGQQLHDAADNPAALADTLGNVEQLVPGSQPTTFQASGDMGIGALERGAATRDPVPFQQRRADQNTARLSVMEGLQQGAAPEAVAKAVRAHLDDVELVGGEVLERATAGARSRVEVIGQGQVPEAAGGAMRGSLETARGAAKAQERALWDAVDPDGSLSLSADNTTSASRRIRAELPTSAKPQEGEEAAIHAVLDRYGNNVPLREMTALQGRLKTAMREERIANGESAAYRRMAQLNAAIEADLEGAIMRKVVADRQAVAAGQMDEEATLIAQFQRNVDAWKRDREALASQISGQVAGAGDGGQLAAARGPFVPATSRGEGKVGSRLRVASGDQGLSSDAGLGEVDGEALGRLTAARDATRQRADTFDNSILRPLRQRDTAAGPYRMLDGVVPSRIFFASPGSADAIKALRNAVGDRAAGHTLAGYIVDRLRRAAMRDDGTLDPAKVETFRRQHSDALRSFPQLDAAFADAAHASETMGRVAAINREAVAEAQLGATGRLLGVSEPQDVVRVVGGIFGRQDAAAEMLRLRSAIGNDREALAGLRQAVADHIAKQFVGNTEAATTGLGSIKADAFQTFVRNNRSALKAAGFTENELTVIDAIAADLKQSNRSLTAVRIPGQSNTAQDVLAAGKRDDTPTTVLKLALTGLAAGGSGTLFAGPVVGPAIGVTTVVIGALRRAGLSRMEDILKDALLNPDHARALLLKVRPRHESADAQTFAQLYSRAALAGLASQQDAVGSKRAAGASLGRAMLDAAPRRTSKVAAALEHRTNRPAALSAVGRAMAARGAAA